MKRAALAAIRAYQRWISPHKGFSCAHRVHRGGLSCSSAGLRLIERRGLRAGLPLLRERLRRCAQLARAMHSAPGVPAIQRGACDCDVPSAGCDGCDHCNLFDLCSSSDKDRKRRKDRR